MPKETDKIVEPIDASFDAVSKSMLKSEVAKKLPKLCGQVRFRLEM